METQSVLLLLLQHLHTIYETTQTTNTSWNCLKCGMPNLNNVLLTTCLKHISAVQSVLTDDRFPWVTKLPNHSLPTIDITAADVLTPAKY